ncbi:MAG: hypothetical protein AAGH15_05355 [Myxococcota bacterium]
MRGLAFLVFLAACAGSQPPVDEGPPPGLPIAGVCATAAEDGPLGVLAVRTEGDTLLGLGANGVRGVLHRAFERQTIRGEPDWDLQLRPDQVRGVAMAELECGRTSCPRVAEAFSWSPVRRFTVPVSPDLLGDLPRGALVAVGAPREGLLSVPAIADGEHVTRVFDRAGRALGTVPRGAGYIFGAADAEGWRAAHLGASGTPGFARFLDGALETRAALGESRLGTPSGWLSWDAEGVHIERVSGRETFAVAAGAGERELRPTHLSFPDYQLWLGESPVGYFHTPTETLHLFEEELRTPPSFRFETSVDHGHLLVSVAGMPTLTIELESGRRRSLSLPAGLALADEDCPPRALPTAAGGFTVALRESGRVVGTRVEDGRAQAVGRPLHAIRRVWTRIFRGPDERLRRGLRRRSPLVPCRSVPRAGTGRGLRGHVVPAHRTGR